MSARIRSTAAFDDCSPPLPDWLPTDSHVRVEPAGEWWDAVKVSVGTVHLVAMGSYPEIVCAALAGLGIVGPVIFEPRGRRPAYYLLVPCGGTDDWQVLGAECLSVACHVGVPPLDAGRFGPHWLIPPGEAGLCDPGAVRGLLGAALGPRSAL